MDLVFFDFMRMTYICVIRRIIKTNMLLLAGGVKGFFVYEKIVSLFLARTEYL